MERKSFAEMECPIARATDEIGDGWSLLILRSAFLGVRCFQGFEERLAVPASTLARRLKLLCQNGLLERYQYKEHPPRSEYLLTDKGLELLPVFLCLAAWGNRWLAPEGAPLQAVHRETGDPLELVLCDARSLTPIGPSDVAIAAGPGASADLRDVLREPIPFGEQAS